MTANSSGLDDPAGDQIVPIIVWRTTLEENDNNDATRLSATVFASRLARRLVSTYTAPGDCVVDFDADPAVRAAADLTGRAYLPLSTSAELADLDQVNQPITLVIIRWPRPGASRSAADIIALFTACRLILTNEAFAIIAVTSAAPGENGMPFAEHAEKLLPGARGAGFNQIHTIVTITASTGADSFTYYATASEVSAGQRDARPTRVSAHTNLLVFAVGSP